MQNAPHLSNGAVFLLDSLDNSSLTLAFLSSLTFAFPFRSMDLERGLGLLSRDSLDLDCGFPASFDLEELLGFRSLRSFDRDLDFLSLDLGRPGGIRSPFPESLDPNIDLGEVLRSLGLELYPDPSTMDLEEDRGGLRSWSRESSDLGGVRSWSRESSDLGGVRSWSRESSDLDWVLEVTLVSFDSSVLLDFVRRRLSLGRELLSDPDNGECDRLLLLPAFWDLERDRLEEVEPLRSHLFFLPRDLKR